MKNAAILRFIGSKLSQHLYFHSAINIHNKCNLFSVDLNLG